MAESGPTRRKKLSRAKKKLLEAEKKMARAERALAYWRRKVADLTFEHKCIEQPALWPTETPAQAGEIGEPPVQIPQV